ncbi:hypothetical protein N475_20200 [Pseudoalteromonas luteoviolacea DSM 6061]|uniref:Uncharacterized protein n=1 Tax=Pseudoalteromonas luteoviolacea DSM 6061 TaxID=1365250 RepID=A0A166VRS8_9GAMM|nr:hypothetical protein N475_20200 [Pseudoalteromonas luteoviolacea DSM 6061]
MFLIALSKEFIHKRYLQYQTVLEPALLRTLFVIWQFNPFSLISIELLSAIRESVTAPTLVQFISRIILPQDGSLEFDLLVHREAVHNYKYLTILKWTIWFNKLKCI